MEPDELTPRLRKLGIWVSIDKVLDGFVDVGYNFLERRVGDEFSLEAKGSLNKIIRLKYGA
jgi:hypothetical protein